MTYLAPGTNSTLRSLSATQTLDALAITSGGQDSDNTPEPARTPEVDSTTKITLRPSTGNPMGDYQVQIQVSGAPDGVTLNRTWSVNDANSRLLSSTLMDLRGASFPNASASNITGILLTNDLTSAV